MTTRQKAQTITFSLPPDMGKLVLQLAKTEHRTVSELIREALRQYSSLHILSEVQRQARKAAKRKGIRPQDIEKIIDEGRN